MLEETIKIKLKNRETVTAENVYCKQTKKQLFENVGNVMNWNTNTRSNRLFSEGNNHKRQQ